MLDELDELSRLRFDTGSACVVDCSYAYECTIHCDCDLDYSFEREVNKVEDFLQHFPYNLRVWQLKHCAGPFYRP